MGSVRIPLHSRKYPNLYTIVDESDAGLVNQFRWSVYPYRSGYRAYRNRPRRDDGPRKIYLSRFLVNAGPDDYVDHINGDTLDNRRENLRVCSNAENLMNRGRNRNNKSGFKGVFWSESDRCWMAKLTIDGKTAWTGYFSNAIDAAHAYDREARSHRGEYALTNKDMGLLPVEDE